MNQQVHFGWPLWQTALWIGFGLLFVGSMLADGELIHAIVVLNGLLVPALAERMDPFRRLTVSSAQLEYVSLFGMRRQQFQLAELDETVLVDMGSMWRKVVLELRGKQKIAFGCFFGFGTQRLGEKIAAIEELGTHDIRPAA
jgi:hypothetical protein